jgi:hypothetical protein
VAADGSELAIAGGRHSREADQHDAADHERRGHGARCALDADDRLIVRALVRRTFEFDAHDAAPESLPALAGDDAIVGDAPCRRHSTSVLGGAPVRATPIGALHGFFTKASRIVQRRFARRVDRAS